MNTGNLLFKTLVEQRLSGKLDNSCIDAFFDWLLENVTTGNCIILEDIKYRLLVVNVDVEDGDTYDFFGYKLNRTWWCRYRIRLWLNHYNKYNIFKNFLFDSVMEQLL